MQETGIMYSVHVKFLINASKCVDYICIYISVYTYTHIRLLYEISHFMKDLTLHIHTVVLIKDIICTMDAHIFIQLPFSTRGGGKCAYAHKTYINGLRRFGQARF